MKITWDVDTDKTGEVILAIVLHGQEPTPIPIMLEPAGARNLAKQLDYAAEMGECIRANSRKRAG